MQHTEVRLHHSHTFNLYLQSGIHEELNDEMQILRDVGNDLKQHDCLGDNESSINKLKSMTEKGERA